MAGAEWLAHGVFEKMNPLMLFNAVLDPALILIGEVVSRGPIVEVAMPEALAEDLGVDLPLIGKYLVHSWVDNALVTEKAGKSDDAGVPTHLWDQRIAQVLEVPVPVISTMRNWLFKRYCRGLMRSLSAFLRSCHGSNWALQLVALRQERRQLSGGADAPLKRLRGGESFFDLERNADAGSDVVCQNSLASWWEWNGGSALIFLAMGLVDEHDQCEGWHQSVCVGQATKVKLTSTGSKAWGFKLCSRETLERSNEELYSIGTRC